jgi:hypothetical protein
MLDAAAGVGGALMPTQIRAVRAFLVSQETQLAALAIDAASTRAAVIREVAGLCAAAYGGDPAGLRAWLEGELGAKESILVVSNCRTEPTAADEALGRLAFDQVKFDEGDVARLERRIADVDRRVDDRAPAETVASLWQRIDALERRARALEGALVRHLGAEPLAAAS